MIQSRRLPRRARSRIRHAAPTARTLVAMTDIRFITDDDVPAFHRAIPFGFGDDLTEEEGTHDRFRAVFPIETCIGAFDDGRVVGTFGSFDFDLTVPGGTVPMAGTTIVTVQPTHRRQGVLSTMMRMHLSQAIDRGQPVAGLWASETPIYGRFGYGLAAHAHDLTIPADRVSVPPGGGDVIVALIDADAAGDILPPVYDDVRLANPGMLSRSAAWWEHRRLRDPEHWRDGASSRRTAVARRAGTPVGYATYRQKEKWENELPEGTVEVMEVIAVDDDVRRALWHYLTHIDLFPTVHWWNAPADNPMYEEVANIRRLITRHRDTLWLRILDIPTALSARRYESDGSIVLGVSDDVLGRGGTHRLTIAGGAGVVEATEDDPDVIMRITDLGSLYLGRPSAHPRWRAGHIRGDAESVLRLDRLFRTTALPFCSEVF